MKIKNGELKFLIAYLDTFELVSTEGRMRTKLKKMLIEKLEHLESDRQDLVKQFSRKGENKEPLVKLNEDGIEVGDIEDVDGFNQQYIILLNEDVIIDETLSNKQMMISVRDTVLGDKTGYKGQAADDWDYWCQVFEQINYDEGVQSHVGD